MAVSLRDGQVTLRVSSRTSGKNLKEDVAIRNPVKPITSRTNPNAGRNPRPAFGKKPCPSRLVPDPPPGEEWRDSTPHPPVLETGALAIELHSSGSGYGEPIRSAAVLSCMIAACNAS